MDVEQFRAHQGQAEPFSEAYAAKLEPLLQDPWLQDSREVIQYMLRYHLRLEQEALLEGLSLIHISMCIRDRVIAPRDYADQVIRLLLELEKSETKEYNSLVFSTYSGLKQAYEEKSDHMYEALLTARRNRCV